MKQMLYIAQDGTYGSAYGIAIGSASHWTTLDWETLDAFTDSERATFANYCNALGKDGETFMLPTPTQFDVLWHEHIADSFKGGK